MIGTANRPLKAVGIALSRWAVTGCWP